MKEFTVVVIESHEIEASVLAENATEARLKAEDGDYEEWSENDIYFPDREVKDIVCRGEAV